MKMKKVFMLLIFFSIFAFMSITVFAASSSNFPKNFNSNGDLIKGWYWLRDNSLQNYTQWIFENIPPGDTDLTLDITALATNRASGGRGFFC